MSVPAKRPPLPVILLANDLLDGDIVFWTGNAWSLDLADAAMASDDPTAVMLEQAMAHELAANRVVDAGLVDVTIDGFGRVQPRHIREQIKTLGPTIRRDLGKQAEAERG
jgi:Protein of unknown function (DUF2849)